MKALRWRLIQGRNFKVLWDRFWPALCDDLDEMGVPDFSIRLRPLLVTRRASDSIPQQSQPVLSVSVGTISPLSLISRSSIRGSECANSKREKNARAATSPPNSVATFVRIAASILSKSTKPLSNDFPKSASGRRLVRSFAECTAPNHFTPTSAADHF